MNKYLMFNIFIFCTIIFTACDSKPQQAQEIQSKFIEKQNNLKSSVYTLTTTTGDKITFEVSDGVLFSKQLNGKTVLLNFWATWCNPCIEEMPTFVELQNKYKNDFIIIGVLFEKEKDKDELLSFLKKFNVNFPITVGKENFELAKHFDDVKMIPESFLYNKAGFFVEKFIGEISKQKLEEYIQSDIK